jgi:magnesium chelatase family protein
VNPLPPEQEDEALPESAVATARTIVLEGAGGHLIDVQVDLSHGLVKTALVGRPDASITEARDRCRSALTNSGFAWPSTRRVTILLSPADLPKRGSHFDLAIALAMLGATRKAPVDALERTVFIGELTLDGRLRAVPGVLPMVLSARSHGWDTVMVPDCQVDEAALVPGMTVLGARSLPQVVAVLHGRRPPVSAPVPPLPTRQQLSWRGERRTDDLDLVDVLGMHDARFALEVAAAGGHHLLLSGPKGAGKTTLAERLPGLLPDLPVEQALELTAVYSLAGGLPGGGPLMTRPPFRAPHHSATRSSVLGGGTGRVRPGEISRAHHGALFLDEFPLYSADIVEGLREPLESGEVTIARGEEIATFPARAMVVLACNPCPCGDFHESALRDRCSCSEVARRQYRRKLTGPVVDRIDITRHVEPVAPHELHDPLAQPESSAIVRSRVDAARRRQQERYDGTAWRLNSDVPGPALRSTWPMTEQAMAVLDARVLQGHVTRRGATRVHRLAWTVADLAGVSSPGVPEVETALRLRTGEPLLLDATVPQGVR